MLVPSAFDTMERLLERFRPCFSRPQFKNFSTYILGLYVRRETCLRRDEASRPRCSSHASR